MVLSYEDQTELEKRCRYLEKQLEYRNEELKDAAEERKMLDELATVNSMTVRKLDMERDYTRTVLPEDALDKIVRLENMLKLEKHKTDAAVKEQKLQALTIAKQDKEINRLTRHMEMLEKETGWTMNSSTKAPYRASAHQDATNRIGELQLIVTRLEEEQKTHKTIERKKTLLIESLSKELDAKKRVEEDYYQSNNNIKLKDREIRDLKEELKVLKRIEAKKDKVINGLESVKDDSTVRCLEGDKRFLQAEVAKHLEARRQNEKTMRAQSHRIEQLEGRLQAISVALKDLKLDKQIGAALNGPLPETPVEAGNEQYEHVVDLQLRHIESLRNALTMKEALLDEKDGNLEAMEKKMEILTHSRASEQRVFADRKYRGETEDLRRALDTQTETFKAQVERLKTENARLRASRGYSSVTH